MLRAISSLSLQLHRFEDALQAARQSLDLCQESDACRNERSNCVTALVAAQLSNQQAKDAVQTLEDERDHYNEIDDRRGEAIALLTMAGLQLERAEYQDALWAVEDAQALFQELEDKAGEAVAMQVTAQVQASAKEYDLAIEAASSAAALSEAAGDRKGQLGSLLLVAHVGELKLAASQLEPTSIKFRSGAAKAVQAAKDAVAVAGRLGEREPLEGAALCVLSRACHVASRGDEAARTAKAAVAVFRESGDRRGEAYALVREAEVSAARGHLDGARQAAGTALLLFQRLGDDRGKGLAQQALDAAEHPPASEGEGEDFDVEPRAAPRVQQAAIPDASMSVDIEQLGRKVRATVVDIVGVDDLDDDTPLMQTGLTSQSAVLLRNALMKEFGGASLPFTMMFDFPSVAALTEFFVQRAE